MPSLSMSSLSITLLLAGATAAQAATITVTGFTQITGASFYDAPRSLTVPQVTVGSVTITPNPNPAFLNSNFSAYGSPQLGSDVPGNGSGFGTNPAGFGGAQSLLLDFSQPVAAFGATFQHSDRVDDHSYTYPVLIEAFSGLDGTGALLGSILDLGGGTTSTTFADFRGLWSTNLDIRSARISATSSPNGGYLVDGFAISLTTQTPEPATLLVTAAGLGCMGFLRRQTRRRLRR